MSLSYRSDLEKAVEQLSELLEEDIEADTIKDLRQRMIDKTVNIPNSLGYFLFYSSQSQVYVRHRHEIMLRDTEEGIRLERWVWTH
jgi:ariadne-1